MTPHGRVVDSRFQGDYFYPLDKREKPFFEKWLAAGAIPSEAMHYRGEFLSTNSIDTGPPTPFVKRIYASLLALISKDLFPRTKR
jgi:hypothetical protein